MEVIEPSAAAVRATVERGGHDRIRIRSGRQIARAWKPEEMAGLLDRYVQGIEDAWDHFFPEAVPHNRERSA